jgi:transposase-like protein
MKSEVTEKWRRHRTTAAERAAWVRRFERSGQTPSEFVRRHGLGRSTLDRWRSPRASVPKALPPLREVRLGPMLGQPQWIAEVQRPDGLTLRLSAAALPWLEQFLAPRPC